MKQWSLLYIIFCVCFSCGSTKNHSNNSINKEETTSVEITTDPIVKELIVNTTDANAAIVASLEKFNHTAWNALLQEHVSRQGKVNYALLSNKRKIITNYISSLGKNKPNTNWSKQDKMAFWINAYNALTIDLILRNYPIKSIKDINKPWEQRLWKLGSQWYSLDQIEHQILRKMDEPRIHFAIVCASYSCPKLNNKAYTASNLERELTKATKEFLNNSELNNLSENHINLSKIFKWFAKDFKTDGTLIGFLNKYADFKISEKAKKSFKAYNWNLNE